MCLLAFAWQTHPHYRFVFAGNRDEFHARPARAANWWQDAPDVFGGRDLEAGGSWMGLRKDGRFAVVTNFREPDLRPAGMRTRGELVTRFLAENSSSTEYLEHLRATRADYAGYNLVFGDLLSTTNELHYFSNREGEASPLDAGVHALSNHLLNTPWPKVARLREQFAGELGKPEPAIESLLGFLGDTRPAQGHELPDTGLSPEWERLLSSPRIVSPEYGTRASTVILVERDGRMHFHERRFTAEGAVEADTEQHFEAA